MISEQFHDVLTVIPPKNSPRREAALVIIEYFINYLILSPNESGSCFLWSASIYK